VPELPEVEIVVRHLRQLLTGRRIINARLLRDKLAPAIVPRAFAARLRGATILDVARRGKNILIRLSNGRTLITHLRMTGQFVLLDSSARQSLHTHAVFVLDRNETLLFNDQRHFGWMNIVDTLRETSEGTLAALGYDPFDDEFTPEILHRSLKRTRRPVKLFLLDQQRIAGLGNIYVAEALFLAGIAPNAQSHRISRPRTQRLYDAIIEVLKQAIAKGSTEKVDNLDGGSVYVGGEFDGTWFVYDREGEPCRVCGTPIKRIRQGQRSTYYCPDCQRR